MIKSRVLCLGHCAWDLFFAVDTFPENDTKVEAARFLEQGGGPAATAAVTLARLNTHVGIIGKIGDDQWGHKILAGFTSEHVDTRGLSVEPERTSPLSCVLVERTTGKRTILHHRGSLLPLSKDDIPGDLISSADILLIDSLHPRGAFEAARIARENGARVVLDTGAFKPWTVDLLHASDIIIAPEYFAPGFTPGKTFTDIAHTLFDLGVEAVVITRGEQGGLCYTRAEEFSYPAFDVDVVDSTGAGDVFHGAFVYGLLKEWPLKKTATFASAVAALKCTGLGGRTAIPSFEEAMFFFRKNRK